MATPIYKGTAQPAATGGWLSGVASWFGGSAPTYAGEGQPSSAGFLGGSTPAYKPAPSTSQSGTAPPCDAERITLVIPRELIGPQQ